MIGGVGADEYRYYTDSGIVDGGSGRDVITDFAKGEDTVIFTADLDGRYLQDFNDLDSNDNNVLDNGDEFVDIAGASYGGVAKTSTIIDVSAETGGLDQLVVFGVTGMTSGDFSTPDY